MVKTKTKTNLIKIKLVKSLIGSTAAQRRIATALGLSKKDQTVEHSETATIMGMVKRITHLLEVSK